MQCDARRGFYFRGPARQCTAMRRDVRHGVVRRGKVWRGTNLKAWRGSVARCMDRLGVARRRGASVRRGGNAKVISWHGMERLGCVRLRVAVHGQAWLGSARRGNDDFINLCSWRGMIRRCPARWGLLWPCGVRSGPARRLQCEARNFNQTKERNLKCEQRHFY